MKEQTMLSCDYNGWADVPEEEREAVDVYETNDPLPDITTYARRVSSASRFADPGSSERRAA